MLIVTDISTYHVYLSCKEIKDPGVCFDSLLVFDKHISERNKQSLGLYDVGYN